MTSPLRGRTGSTAADRAARIWEETGPRVALYLRRRISDPLDREDLSQETYLRLQRAIEEEAIRSEPAGYVHGIVKNLVLKYIRHRVRHPTSSVEDGPEPATPPRAEESFLEDEDRRALNQAVETLRPDDREVIRLAYQQGLKGPEVARRLGRSPEWVRQRLTRARRTLREALVEVEGRLS